MKITEGIQVYQHLGDMRATLMGYIAFRWNKAITKRTKFALKYTPSNHLQDEM